MRFLFQRTWLLDPEAEVVAPADPLLADSLDSQHSCTRACRWTGFVVPFVAGVVLAVVPQVSVVGSRKHCCSTAIGGKEEDRFGEASSADSSANCRTAKAAGRTTAPENTLCGVTRLA